MPPLGPQVVLQLLHAEPGGLMLRKLCEADKSFRLELLAGVTIGLIYHAFGFRKVFCQRLCSSGEILQHSTRAEARRRASFFTIFSRFFTPLIDFDPF